jgi:hypothetical protein
LIINYFIDTFLETKMFNITLATFLLVFLLPASKVTAAPEPSIKINKAINASQLSDSSVKVGDFIQVNKGGFAYGSFAWGGINSIAIFPESYLKFRSYGNRANGARYTEVEAGGEVLISVLTRNPNSQVKACFKNRWGYRGCSVLRSSVRIAPLESGEQIVAVTEGRVTVQDEEEKTPSQVLVSGQYSLLKSNGSFSLPLSAYKTQGYKLISYQRSKTIGVFQSDLGWRFVDGDLRILAPIGAPLRLLSPLVPSRPLLLDMF